MGSVHRVDRVLRHAPADDVGGGVELRAAVVINHALGVARGAAGVVEGDRVPLVGGQLPGKLRVAFGEQALVAQAAKALRRRAIDGVFNVDQ